MKERVELHEEIAKTRVEVDGVHLYLDAVLAASSVLVEKEVPVSESMDKTVRQNLQDIREGTGSLPTYHAREVAALSSDALSSLSKGDLGQAAINASGAALNTVGFFIGGAEEARQQKLRGPSSTSDDSPSRDSDRSSDDNENSGCSVM